jgi:Domain of unknown function (DUF929)
MPEQTGSKPSGSSADKDRARSQSRSVSQAPAKSTKKASAKKAAARRPAAAPGRSRGTLLAWGAVALVVVIVVVFVVVKVTSSNNSTAGTQRTELSSTVIDQVTQIPASVYDKVGITSPATAVTPPTVIKGQTPLVLDGKPGVFYEGGEFCPYCAAERWAMIAALSRFGTFTNLGGMASNPNDVFPSTQTFTFHGSTYTSPYLTFQPVEHYSNTPSGSGGYEVLTPLTASQQALVSKYNTTAFLGSGASPGSIPFINFGNNALVAGASYSPSILAGLSRDQIAAGLSDASNPVTQAIITTANYLSASICQTTGQQPAAVCTSKGVTEAAKAMGLSS